MTVQSDAWNLQIMAGILFSTNDKGDLILHEISQWNIVCVKENNDNEWGYNALWSLDVSQDDKVIAVGSENNYIKLYSFNKLLFADEQIGIDDDIDESSQCKLKN